MFTTDPLVPLAGRAHMAADPPARPARQDPTTCPHLVWLKYRRPVRRPAEGVAYNVRCSACGERAWRG